MRKKDSKKPELRIYIHLGDISGNICANVACNCIFIKYVTLFPPPPAAFYLFLNIFLSLASAMGKLCRAFLEVELF